MMNCKYDLLCSLRYHRVWSDRHYDISKTMNSKTVSSKHIQFLPSYNNIKGSIFVFRWQNKTTYIFPECNTILLHNKRVRFHFRWQNNTTYRILEHNYILLHNKSFCFHFSLTKQYHLQNSRTQYHIVTQQKALFSLTKQCNLYRIPKHSTLFYLYVFVQWIFEW